MEKAQARRATKHIENASAIKLIDALIDFVYTEAIAWFGQSTIPGT
jgi:hypothetical protein